MTSIFQKLLSFGFAFLAGGVIGGELRITSVVDFARFENNVERGTNYKGTTVFLDSDLSLTGWYFEPIGYSSSNYFSGTFDGQGHVISNLEMYSTLRYLGLFGYSEGLTIKNVILDSSCSIKSSFRSNSSNAWIGGIIGHCDARNGPCIIENSVNMGSVTFSGNVSSGGLYLGGIAGCLSSSFSNRDITVKNCANYGDITYSGESSGSYVGGIVGDSDGISSTKRAYIYNCLNHGTITHSGTTSNALSLGGIAGYTYQYTTIENCVSCGKISLLTKASSENCIGSIVGEVYSSTSIKYTYFTSDLSGYKKYGSGTPSSESNTLSYDSTSFELDGTVSIGNYTGTSLIDAINAYSDYYTLRDYSHWLLNKGNNAVSFTINRNSTFTLNTQIILLPSLASEGESSFDGWYNDKNCTVPFEKTAVEEDIALYGKYEGGKSIAPSLFPYATLLLSFLISLVAF